MILGSIHIQLRKGVHYLYNELLDTLYIHKVGPRLREAQDM